MEEKYYELRNCPDGMHIMALVDIPEHGVKAGDLGGKVGGYKNLAQDGSWIEWGAEVSAEALVSGGALVKSGSRICDSARVCGKNTVVEAVEMMQHAAVLEGSCVKSASIYGWTVIEGGSIVLGHTGFSQSTVVVGSFIEASTEISDSYIEKSHIFSGATVRGARIEGSNIRERANICGSIWLERGLFGCSKIDWSLKNSSLVISNSTIGEYEKVTDGIISQRGESYVENVEDIAEMRRMISYTGPRKYEIDFESPTAMTRPNFLVFPIRALVDIPEHGVKAGDFGGKVTGYHCLCADPSDSSWIEKGAIVSECAMVFGGALVKSGAVLRNGVRVSGRNTIIGSEAKVYGRSSILGGHIDSGTYEGAVVVNSDGTVLIDED
ncbi:MAG: hypothetical protein K6F57_01640 [Candidatus Saccharibacteria bacterium]|nr:hypothetical protein [Candidatus Saccharibacteria bacterium]